MSDDSFDDGTDEILREFLIESEENIDQLANELIALEENPRDPDRLAAIFRSVHTIKGTCGFFGFEKLESITHAGENLLSKLRDGELVLNPAMTDALLKVVDAVKEILGEIQNSGVEGNTDYSALVQNLEALLSASPQAESDQAPEASATEPTESDEEASEDEAKPAPPLGKLLVSEQGVATEQVVSGLAKQLSGDERPLGEILVKDEGVEEEKVTSALSAQEVQKSQASASSLADTTIRVDVELLDKLMNMVGELVLSRNQILQYSTALEDPTFTAASQRLNLITSELQEGVMKTRMQPISAVWSKFPRVVRDLANGCGKQVAIEMEGKDTELDKSILEAIKDPLTHIVRNSVDHGIESPEDRAAAGKPEEGTLLLRAYHEGGQVIIEIVDDGRGINYERVAQKAIERGLVTPQDVKAMSPRELTNLIMLPGFSTAEKVTNISGRGVGMDVVKTNIEKIGGTIDLQSEPGQGTTLRIKIPLTLAIIPALIITADGDRYAIPQVNLVELVRLEGEDVRSKVEFVHGSPVYRLRGNLLPLVYLDKVMGADRDEETVDEALNIVVLQAEDRQFGLIVESVHDTEEIVVKPLGKQLKEIEVFAGATIMGDGVVALILDTMGLAHTASVISETRQRGISETAATTEAGSGEAQTVLLFQCGEYGRMAIPLNAVARLEEFASDTIENVGGMRVVQYRGEILPLVHVAEVFHEPLLTEESDEARAVHAVVYSEAGKNVGLLVERILDITEASLAFKGQASRPGVEFTGVIDGKVAEFVDVRHIISSAIPEFFEAGSAPMPVS